MKLNKDDITALTGTIIIHVIALVLLYFGVLRAYVPIDDGGATINFGDYTAVAGIYQPAASTTVTQPRQTQPQPQPIQPQQRQNQARQTPPRPSGETVITQDKEETVSVAENTANTNAAVAAENARREREENERRQREEEERRLEELRKQEEAIDNRASSAFSVNTQENSQGEAASGISNPGNPFGSTPSRSIEGSGGASFNLSGRTTGSGGLPRPGDAECDDGRIVINITVDPNGNVISAEIGRGTNINNITMRNSALDAARRAKFNKISSANNQSGTITYNYKCQ